MNNGSISILLELKVTDDVDSRLLRSGMTNNILLSLISTDSTNVRHWYVILDREVEDPDGYAAAGTLKTSSIVISNSRSEWEIYTLTAHYVLK